jgi:RecA/RadA recombinase
MDQFQISVTDLCRLSSDPKALEDYLSSKPRRPYFESQTNRPVKVFGSFFHRVACQVSIELGDPKKAAITNHLSDPDAIYRWIEEKWTQEFLRELLQKQQVDSAAQLGTALFHFSSRLANLRNNRPWSEILVQAERAVSGSLKIEGNFALFGAGLIDVVRTRQDGDLDVVDYKLSYGNRIEQELLQLAIYAKLLTGQERAYRYHGSLEYFLPQLHIQELTGEELERLYETKVVPTIDVILKYRAGKVTLPVGSPLFRITNIVLGKRRDNPGVELQVELSEFSRHSAVLGGTGSGKTTLALSIVEQVLAAGIPVVLLDRKGDLSRYADHSVWQEAVEPAAERLRQLQNSVRVDLFTPGSKQGRPLGISLAPADASELSEDELSQSCRSIAVSIGSMMGLADRLSDQPKIAILAKAILVLVSEEHPVTLESLIPLLQKSPPKLLQAIGALDPKHCKKLVESLQTLAIMRGDFLAQGPEMLKTEILFAPDGDGKTRLSVINTQHLDDAAFFWIAQFLLELGRFARHNPSTDIQGLVMIDEADIYLPANSIPPTKVPLENLLRRGRSAGIGVMLVTQSPGDLDYRCRENVRSWFIGLVKQNTALEKLKPMFPADAREIYEGLSKQKVGEFCLVADGDVTVFRANRNLVETKQLPEDEILRLARQSA